MTTDGGHVRGPSVWHDGRPANECDACQENLKYFQKEGLAYVHNNR